MFVRTWNINFGVKKTDTNLSRQIKNQEVEIEDETFSNNKETRNKKQKNRKKKYKTSSPYLDFFYRKGWIRKKNTNLDTTNQDLNGTSFCQHFFFFLFTSRWSEMAFVALCVSACVCACVWVCTVLMFKGFHQRLFLQDLGSTRWHKREGRGLIARPGRSIWLPWVGSGHFNFICIIVVFFYFLCISSV